MALIVFVCAWLALARRRIRAFFYGMQGRQDPETTPLIEITDRDRELVANGWHPDDVIAARRNGIALPDKPPY